VDGLHPLSLSSCPILMMSTTSRFVDHPLDPAALLAVARDLVLPLTLESAGLRAETITHALLQAHPSVCFRVRISHPVRAHCLDLLHHGCETGFVVPAAAPHFTGTLKVIEGRVRLHLRFGIVESLGFRSHPNREPFRTWSLESLASVYAARMGYHHHSDDRELAWQLLREQLFGYDNNEVSESTV
jgi:hypothetical protein